MLLSFVLHEIVNNQVEKYGGDQWFLTFSKEMASL